jgi:hypothetical protein
MAGKKKFPERRSGLRPSEKELPERRSVTKILLVLCGFNLSSVLMFRANQKHKGVTLHSDIVFSLIN